MTGAKTTTADREARATIVSDLDTTFLVEAGAGSGKTQSLVGRLIAVLASWRATIGTEAVLMEAYHLKRAQIDGLWSFVANKGEKKLSGNR